MRCAVSILLVIILVTGPLASRGLAETPEKEPVLSDVVGRSSKLAFLMSLFVPGLGELYYGAPKRGAAFLAVEAGSWVAYASWHRKGGAIERDFMAFADGPNGHWDIAKYLDWKKWDDGTSPLFYIQGETLPSKASDRQQYYELIGKYDQFVFGWDDGKDPQGKPVGTNYTIYPGQVTSANRAAYEIQRNRSNRFFGYATNTLGFLVVNHLASAVDASIHARGQHARLWVDADVIGSTEPVPAMLLNVRF